MSTNFEFHYENKSKHSPFKITEHTNLLHSSGTRGKRWFPAWVRGAGNQSLDFLCEFSMVFCEWLQETSIKEEIISKSNVAVAKNFFCQHFIGSEETIFFFFLDNG